MGTPDFAVPSLKVLIDNGYDVVGVITGVDKPSGRGQKLKKSAVKEFAEHHNLRILQPEKLKDDTFIDELKSLGADLQIVVAFRMLPEIVWKMPRLGTFNLHSSLLPNYRGAAPINWAIINGEKETGVTSFFLTHKIDTGDIIYQEKVTINEKENVGTLHDKLMNVGANLVLETVKAIETDTCKSIPQPEGKHKPAPKIFTETCKIDLSKSAKQIYDFIRGLSPYPTAYLTIKDNKGEQINMKIYESEIVNTKEHSETKFITDNKSFLHMQYPQGTLAFKCVQLPGKKALAVKDLLNGNKFLSEYIIIWKCRNMLMPKH